MIQDFLDPDQRRNAERLGHDDGVRVLFARFSDNAGNLLMIEGSHVRWQDLAGDKDTGVLEVEDMAPFTDQVGQQAPADIFHVGRSFAQVAVFHPLECADVIADNFLEGVRGAMAVADFILHLLDEGTILENHQVGMEN